MISLNTGRRYHITGSPVKGYRVTDCGPPGLQGSEQAATPTVVFASEYATDCYSWRTERDQWESATGRRSK